MGLLSSILQIMIMSRSNPKLILISLLTQRTCFNSSRKSSSVRRVGRQLTVSGYVPKSDVPNPLHLRQEVKAYHIPHPSHRHPSASTKIRHLVRPRRTIGECQTVSDPLQTRIVDHQTKATASQHSNIEVFANNPLLLSHSLLLDLKPICLI